MTAEPRAFRFRPRMRGLALVAMAIAGGVIVLGAVEGAAAPIVLGGAVALLAVAYLASPAWRLVVTVDDEALVVGTPARERFRLPWAEVVRVVASPTTGTCFVDGGTPARSLLVPGDGAPASYDVEHKAALYAFILAHVAADRVQTVARLDDPLT